jgi:hypothetical protein
MTQTTASPVRARVRAFSFVVAALVAVGIVGACAETRRANGEACLKDQDCLTGICSQLVCSAAPPTTNVEANGEGGATEAGGDGGGATDTGGGTDGGTEAEAAPAESGSGEAAADGGGD